MAGLHSSTDGNGLDRCGQPDTRSDQSLSSKYFDTSDEETDEREGSEKVQPHGLVGGR